MKRIFVLGTTLCVIGIGSQAHGANFETLGTLLTADKPAAIVAGDYDNDRDNDLAIVATNDSNVQIFRNKGEGDFILFQTISLGPGAGPVAMLSGDFDNDGDNDLVVALKNLNQVRFLVNTAGTFTLGGIYSTGLQPVALALGDLNQDGRLDIVAVNQASNSITVLKSTGNFNYGVTNADVGMSPRSACMGNIDTDNDLDIIVTNGADRSLSIMRNLGPAFSRTDWSVGTQISPGGISMGDTNLDGDLDIVTPTVGDNFNLLSTFANSGNGSYTGPINFIVNGSGANTVSMADLDGDGDLDTIVGNETSNTLSLLTNSGPALFSLSETYLTGSRPSCVIAADLDGSGTLEIGATNLNSNTATLYRNNLNPPKSQARSIEISSGEVLSGDLTSIQAIDGDSFVAFNNPDSLQPSADILFRSPYQTPSTIAVELVSAVDQAGTAGSVMLYDHFSQSWITVGCCIEQTSLTRNVAFRRSGTHRFVDAARNVKVRIHWASINDDDPAQDGWGHRVDYMNLQFTP